MIRIGMVGVKIGKWWEAAQKCILGPSVLT